jgi:hypothetical protein
MSSTTGPPQTKPEASVSTWKLWAVVTQGMCSKPEPCSGGCSPWTELWVLAGSQNGGIWAGVNGPPPSGMAAGELPGAGDLQWGQEGGRPGDPVSQPAEVSSFLPPSLF